MGKTYRKVPDRFLESDYNETCERKIKYRDKKHGKAILRDGGYSSELDTFYHEYKEFGDRPLSANERRLAKKIYRKKVRNSFKTKGA